jgi:hypothetical protein
MKIKKFFFIKTFVLFGLSLLLLASCGKPTESPEDVIQKFKEQATEINSGDISADVTMKGTDAEDAIDFTANANFKFDRNDPEDKKADIKFALSGMLKTAQQSLDGEVDFNLRTIASDYYILLDKLDFSSEQMKSLEPILEKYIGNWLHVSDEFIPENVRQMQEKDEATLAKEKQLKQLFVDTDLFTVTKEYGVENVNGQKAYHYGIQFDENGVQDYVRKAAVIDGRELEEDDIKESSKIVSYVESADIWIGASDYYLYKATAHLTGGFTETEADMSIDVTVEGSDYNRPVKITAPADSEEFNPLELLMAYSTLSMGTDEAADVEAIPAEVTEE